MLERLPQKLFVMIANKGTIDAYYDVSTELTELNIVEEGCRAKVGIYQLVETQTAINKTEFVKK